MTKTQSVSATKLAVATAVLFVAGGLAMATAPAMQQGKSYGPTSGSNWVKTTYCEQKGADIEINKNNGPKYMLKAGCKDTGYGYRNYAFECVKGGYQVSWTPCATLSVATDNETYTATGGVVTVGLNKLLAVFNFSAYIKDATISGLILNKTGTLQNKNLTNIKLTDANGTTLANGQLGVAGPDKMGFAFNQVVPFGTGMPTKLMISADILDATPGGDTLSLSITYASFINTGSDILTAPKIEGVFPVTYGPLLISQAAYEGGQSAATPVLFVTWANDTPSGVAAPSMGQIVGKLKFFNSGGAGQEAAKINSLAIQPVSTFPTSGWKLYNDSVSNSPLAEGQAMADKSSPSTLKIVFSNFETMIAGGQDKTFFITANTTDATKFQQTSPNTLSIKVNSASDIGSSITVKDQFPLQWKTFTY